MRNTVIGLVAAAAIITAGSTLSVSAGGYGGEHAMRAIVAHRASMVVVNTVPSMVAVSTIGNLNAENTSVGSLVAVSTVGNLNAVNIPVGSLVAVNTVGI